MAGRFVLRIEDIDPARSKPEFTAAIFEDLAWLGLRWDEPVWCQSIRLPVYAGAAGRLRAQGLLYPCFCSRTEVAERSSAADPDGAPLYSGTCRHLGPTELQHRLASGAPVQHRLDMAEALRRSGLLTYSVAGPTPADRPQIRYADPVRWGDVVLQRKEVPTSYHLSVVVDDDEQGVTHVTRGRDMEASTDIHVLLQFLLGLSSPIYTFHRLIVGDDGRKLSKSEGSTALRALRDRGWSPDGIRREVGF
jgi:glutamyl-Q tRNA(Asp) synthetase